jgi:hypothetical protein
VLLALTAAVRPAVLSQAAGGLWEVSGGPGSRTQRICVPDTYLLAQYEHRKSSCSRIVVRDTRSSAEIHYTCTGGGFGQSTIGLLTPRSLRIETQGISNNAPFHYTLQARRVGNC